eukprot:4192892-Prymnesium_polylepis.2
MVANRMLMQIQNVIFHHAETGGGARKICARAHAKLSHPVPCGSSRHLVGCGEEGGMHAHHEGGANAVAHGHRHQQHRGN